ncbi:hypothetical protein AYO21_06459 [Fonsecaea monophora]|uniref:Uncharacterized protein n=1 Tax=Fonsecaea monophora TaxID=254056 RepID=A0A177F4S9_9EURO|nr:hypothetical protein AYO21_06459 [Fonsecaea monophora]KAH0830928.1 hypothetical protein FOPE_02133 [Fonsecaea pedrosoi]OAG39255.1 hypothetical protein AYO21_06459 [Fonsecaea monophora]
MADDPSKAQPLGSAPATIPAVDGSADEPPNTAPERGGGPVSNPTAQPAPTQPAQPLQDHEGDLVMTSPESSLPNPPMAATTASSNERGPGPVPLDSPLRTTPIHPSVEAIKVPETALTSAAPNTNPITLQPFTEAELVQYGFEQLRAQIFATHGVGVGDGDGGAGGNLLVLGEKEKQEIARIREETAALLKQKLDEREARVREIEREMEDKEKIREVERKVFRKKLAAGGGEGGVAGVK